MTRALREITAGVVVGVFRKCIWCQAHKRIGGFEEHAVVCSDCFRQRWSLPAGTVRARAVRLTDRGRAALLVGEIQCGTEIGAERGKRSTPYHREASPNGDS